MTSSVHDDSVRDDGTSKLPILPEIAQNRTGSHTSPPADDNGHPAATPVQVQRAPTPPPATPGGLLSTRQLNAIPLILQGLSDDDIAESVGVRREAVNRWRNRHPRFIAELNRQRHLLHAATVDRHHRLLNDAMAIFERWQASKNLYLEDKLKTASTLLRSAAARRTLSPTSLPTPTNPTEILDLLHSQGLTPSPDDSPEDDAPPPHS